MSFHTYPSNALLQTKDAKGASCRQCCFVGRRAEWTILERQDFLGTSLANHQLKRISRIFAIIIAVVIGSLYMFCILIWYIGCHAGAGLGRLCLELTNLGFEVQGNEFSYYMLLTSSFILNNTQRAQQWTVFPWMHNNCNQKSIADQLRGVGCLHNISKACILKFES